ncbi:MAG: hypothetical protein HYS23_15345 [Geobacter sp.]|nr:hypothetical protein [Geobacter sp.]
MRFYRILALVFCLFTLETSWADEQKLDPVKLKGMIVGEVLFSPMGKVPTAAEMSKVDKLVPVLKKQGEGKMVRIEGFVPAAKGGKPDIKGSLYLAKHVESYLRKRHKLNLDMYLTVINDTMYKKKIVRFTVFEKEYETIKVKTPAEAK